jgi:hypothetical protein
VPAQRQINTHSLTAHLVEVRDTDGTLYPSVAVDPGESVDWPQPIAGFTGWAAEPEPAESETGEPEPAGAESTSATPAKSRTKASAKAADIPEATA